MKKNKKTNNKKTVQRFLKPLICVPSIYFHNFFQLINVKKAFVYFPRVDVWITSSPRSNFWKECFTSNLFFFSFSFFYPFFFFFFEASFAFQSSSIRIASITCSLHFVVWKLLLDWKIVWKVKHDNALPIILTPKIIWYNKCLHLIAQNLCRIQY